MSDETDLLKALTGSASLGQYVDTVVDRLDAALEAAWKVSSGMDLQGLPNYDGQGGGPFRGADTAWSAVADQLLANYPGPSNKPRSLVQKATLLEALVKGIDAKRGGGSTTPPSTGGGTGTSSWSALPTMTSSMDSGERSSFQSAVPSWGSNGMTVSLNAKGDKSGTPNPTSGNGTQRCEILLSGWSNMTGTQYLRYDFTLSSGFPTATNDWQTIAQLKNSSTGSPPLELMVGKSNRVYLQWHNAGGSETGTEYLGAATTGVRHSVILKVPFTTASNAPVSGWYDGQVSFTDKSHGGTLYSGQSTYAKLGIYRSNSIGIAATITHHAVAKGSTFEAVAGKA